MERVHIKLHGRVQGVGFRVAAQRKARDLGVRGWVRNTAGGSVEIVAESAPQSLAAFLEWCRRGPEQAAVRSVEIERGAPEGETPFRILADAD